MDKGLDKKFYKIREVAALLEVPASTLRFWESQFTVIKPTRNAHGIRLYTPDDIEVIRLIHYLVKEKGLKLDAAQEQIRHNRSNISKRHQAIRRLEDIKSTLKDMLHALSSRQQ